jgi:hypothetical protein
MTWGLWRTKLLLPAESTAWAADQRRTVLLHELAHAKRWDCLTQFLTQLAEKRRPRLAKNVYRYTFAQEREAFTLCALFNSFQLCVYSLRTRRPLR